MTWPWPPVCRLLVHLYSDEQVMLMNLLIMAPLLLLLGEVTPKTIAVTNRRY